MKKVLPLIIVVVLVLALPMTALAAEGPVAEKGKLTTSTSIVAAKTAKKTTGLYKVNGVWKYYENGKFKKVTGLVKEAKGGTWHYVKDGIFNKGTGLVKCAQPGKNKGKWFFVRKGTFSKETGLVQCIQPGQQKGRWFFVKRGAFKKSTGPCKSIQPGKTYGKEYYVKKGALAVETWYKKTNKALETKYYSLPKRKGEIGPNISEVKKGTEYFRAYYSYLFPEGGGSGTRLLVLPRSSKLNPYSFYYGNNRRYLGTTSDGMFDIYTGDGGGGSDEYGNTWPDMFIRIK